MFGVAVGDGTIATGCKVPEFGACGVEVAKLRAFEVDVEGGEPDFEIAWGR